MEQEIKEKLNRSARNKLDRPTSEMPGMHQPSAFSTKIFVSKSILLYAPPKIDQVEQESKEKLNRSASNKLDRPTSEMPGMHQPSAFSTKIFVSKSILLFIPPNLSISHLFSVKFVGNATVGKKSQSVLFKQYL